MSPDELVKDWTVNEESAVDSVANVLENEDDEGATNDELATEASDDFSVSVDDVAAALSVLDDAALELDPAAVNDSSDDSVGSTKEVLTVDVVASDDE